MEVDRFPPAGLPAHNRKPRIVPNSSGNINGLDNPRSKAYESIRRRRLPVALTVPRIGGFAVEVMLALPHVNPRHALTLSDAD